jgi:tetratricopeptide (TPR) repeat protein
VRRLIGFGVFAAVMAATGPAWVANAADAPKGGKKGKGEDSQREAQIDYAKKLYGEGVEAMGAKDYDLALTRFREAYRYAPDLHLFTFNIASAAELSGDCGTARTYYTMFLDLVPEHPERDAARKTLEKLQETCPYSEEGTAVEIIKQDESTERKESRANVEEERVLQEAFDAIDRAARMYGAIASAKGGAQPFKRVGNAKKRHRKRVRKLFKSHGLELRTADEDASVPMPSSLDEACNAAASLEKKSGRVFTEVTELIDTREMWRVMNRYRRASEGRFRNAFQNSCPKS